MPATTARIKIDDEALLDLLRALIRARSVHEPATSTSEQPAAELVAGTMRGFGWEPEVVEVAPGRPNVVTVVEGGGGPGPTLMFCGHTDVVTEGDLSTWTVDPYGAEERDGRIYGRGSADMKAGLAAMIHAVRALQLAGPFPGRIVIAALADEEGLMLGAKHLARTAIAREVDGVIVGEPEGGEVCPVSKGAMRLRFELVGKMAHGAMPERGRSPIPAITDVLLGLLDLQYVLVDDWGEHEVLGRSLITPTVVQAGDLDQINVIPARAVIALDVRTTPVIDHDRLLRMVVGTVGIRARSHGLTMSYEVVDDRPAVNTPVDHPVVQAVVAAHRKVHRRKPVIGGVPGATDGTILTRDAGLATVVYGPGDKWIAHQADEHVKIADVLASARVYAQAARIFLTRRPEEGA